ncbi:MAG TPA: VOC family protein [Candidatus Limnocylindria bacterium]|nr:VOC family protein [Candidatus Limnocylindria bacterium]
MIKQMNLAWISVSDIKKAKEFFVNTLGMDIKSSAEEYGWLEVSGKEDGGMWLGIGQARPESAERAGMNAVVTMVVDDIVKAKADLTAKGGTLYW